MIFTRVDGSWGGALLVMISPDREENFAKKTLNH